MNRCPVGPSYAMAFAVTIHVQRRHVRFPAVPLGFGATGACLLLTHGGKFRQCNNFGSYLRGKETWQAPPRAVHPPRAERPRPDATMEMIMSTTFGIPATVRFRLLEREDVARFVLPLRATRCFHRGSRCAHVTAARKPWR